MTYSILGIGNPFGDRQTEVDRSFFWKQNLPERHTTFTSDHEAVENTWAAANPAKNEWTPGGSCTNVVRTLAQLGHKVALCGKIGNDPMGIEIESRLSKIGVHSLLSRTPVPTGIVNCFTYNKDRTLHASLGSSSHFSQEDLKESFFQNVQHMHSEGYAAYFGEVLLTAVGYAKKHGATISLDLASPNVVSVFRAKFEACLPDVDFLFGNLGEMQALTGCQEVQKMTSSFLEKQSVIVTNGNGGCWVKWKDKSPFTHYPAEIVPTSEIKDPTGAGDALAGVVISCALDGYSESVCIELGQFAASLVIRERGTDLPEEKWELLRSKKEQLVSSQTKV